MLYSNLLHPENINEEEEMNSTPLSDKIQRIAQDLEALRIDVMQEIKPSDAPSLKISDETGQEGFTDILGLIQKLDTRMSGIETSLERIQGEAATNTNLESKEKQAIQLLVNFFQETGGEFSLESLDVLLSQARFNTCLPQQVNREVKEVEVDSIQANNVVDVKGLICPMPTLHSIKTIGSMAKGEILRVDGDDPGCRNVLHSWCEQAGHSYLGEKDNSDYRSYFIRKG
jgi:tRNA 2-thiouridine synthesizing protein A